MPSAVRADHGPLCLNDIPTEILIDVFDLARNSLLADTQDACDLGFSLMLVSRRMNEVAKLVVLSLWSTIHISWDSEPSMKVERMLARTQASLAASKDEFLNAVLRAPWSDSDSAHQSSTTHILNLTFFEIIALHAYRVRSLDAHLQCINTLDLFCHAFHDTAMPVLRSLRLCLNKEPYKTRDGKDIRRHFPRSQEVFQGAENLPLLEELVLEGCGLDRLMIGPPHGTQLNITRFSEINRDAWLYGRWEWEDFRRNLQDMPLLQDLVICLNQSPFPEFWNPEVNEAEGEPITCPNIISLHLNNCTTALLQLIVTPRLQSLTLQDCNLESVMDFLFGMKHTLFPYLTSLCLIEADAVWAYDPEPSERDHAHLFRHAPAVCHLFLQANHEPNTFLHVLKYLAKRHEYWPALSYISTTYMKRHILLKFLRSSARCLKRIEVQQTMDPMRHPHVSPLELAQEAAKQGVEIVIPEETCPDCFSLKRAFTDE